MKAAVLHELSAPLRIETDVELPELKPGQVLVKVAYSGVCHSQLMEARGKRGNDPYLPHLLGHEGSGVVVETGNGVSKVAPGDRVILGWIKSRGLDAGGAQFRCGSRIFNAGGVTTFNEYAVASENRCVKVPDGIPMDIAVLFGCAVPTGAGIVINTVQPRDGSSIAVFGLGGIGLSALMALKLFSCARVIAVDINPDKLQLAADFGATDLINAHDENPVEAVRRITSGAGADYSVEAAGLSTTIEQAFQSVRRGGGLCVFASHPEQGSRITLDPYELICGKQIQGSWGGNTDPDRDLPRFAQLYREGRLPLEKLITRRYTLAQINEALDDLEHKRVGRPLIEIDPSAGNPS